MSETEEFWAGNFGDEYAARNRIAPQARVPFFRELLRLAPDVRSVCELGANRGHNLQALQLVSPTLELAGVEINAAAWQAMQACAGITAHQSPLASFAPGRQYDLVFTAGVLIHISSEQLPEAFDKLASLSRRYVLINEYFNPTPMEIVYRGHSGKLFKRDFAGDFMDRCPDFEPVAYGFLWKRLEPAWDNSTWTLLRRLDESPMAG